MSEAHEIAKITWNEGNGRYELHIMGQLKAYTLEPHDESKKEMCQMASDKGYTVIEG